MRRRHPQPPRLVVSCDFVVLLRLHFAYMTRWSKRKKTWNLSRRRYFAHNIEEWKRREDLVERRCVCALVVCARNGGLFFDRSTLTLRRRMKGRTSRLKANRHLLFGRSESGRISQPRKVTSRIHASPAAATQRARHLSKCAVKLQPSSKPLRFVQFCDVVLFI